MAIGDETIVHNLINVSNMLIAEGEQDPSLFDEKQLERTFKKRVRLR